ncbi:MAG: sigma-70 family RNA polymerase sigma factor [Planctomycetales bacterium]|nr:sigma-70 family RNA polymerase sigma factor [Planctomycetales bacterium]
MAPSSLRAPPREQSAPLAASRDTEGGPPQDPDLPLARRAISGDKEALAELFGRYKDLVFGVAARVLGDEAEAADVLQDVFLLLLTGGRGTPPGVTVRGWIARVSVNLAIDRWRRRQVRSGKAGDPRDPPAAIERVSTAPGPDEEAQAEERNRAVRAEVERLSPKLRTVVALRYAGGLAYDEIAAALRCSIGTVKSRLARAHERLEGPLAEIRKRHGGS